METVTKPSRILRLKDVLHLTGLGRSSIYKFMKAGDFPQSLPLGSRRVGWLEADIEAWIIDRTRLRE